jgi:ABC-type transport system substrate-binding protein
MNVSKPPLDDQRIGQAVSLCIDRDAFIKAFAGGQGQWALAASRPGLFTESEAKQILKYDPVQAKQLVSQAGYPNAVDIEVSYISSNGPQFAAVVQLLQSQLRNGNFNVTLKPLDVASSSARRRSGDYQVDVESHPFGSWLDLDGILYPGFYPNTANNWARVNDPPLTSLLVQQRRETDATKRRELWRQAVRRINEVPWALGLFLSAAYQVWQAYVKNYAPNLSVESYSVDATEVWLSK